MVYALAGGADQGRFSIDSSTGVLTFKSPPDYEANASAAGNNAYNVIVRVTDDGQTLSGALAPGYRGPGWLPGNPNWLSPNFWMRGGHD